MMRGAVLVAAGKGVRVGGKIPKQFVELRGKPVLAHTLDAFYESGFFQEIVLVVPPGYRDYVLEKVLQPYFQFSTDDRIREISLQEPCIVEGSQERRKSVHLGIQELNPACQTVCIHDGVRPLVSRGEIAEVVKAGEAHGAATLAIPLKDTLKEVDYRGVVLNTLPRENYRLIQTPQCFSKKILAEAHQQAEINGEEATDDASLVEQMGVAVKTIEGSYRNLKITTPEDLVLAGALWDMKE